MPNLDDILGAILSSIASARRMADEQTAQLAEQYLKDPLLAGMTVPRIRLPEVIVDLPILVEGCDFTPAAGEAAGARAAGAPGRPTATGFADLGTAVLQRVHATGGATGPTAGPPTLRVLVAAADLHSSDKATISRLRLTVREEGLEVTQDESAGDGPSPRGPGDEPGRPRGIRLIPE